MREVNILLIEDNQADAFFIKEGFRNSELNPTLQNIEDGDKALAYFDKEQDPEDKNLPDLILLDLNLPKADGFTILSHIKNHPRWKRTPVIILTSSSAPTDIERSYDLYANSYVLKPIGLDEMFKTVSLIEQFWFGLNQLPT